MNDLTYEFQRMVSRRQEIQETTKADGLQTAWEKYSRAHGLDGQRFRSELSKLRVRFDRIASGREPEESARPARTARAKT
ncbi:MAG TPA: hypothetical protein VE974_24390 [Thermoanaerobaculia bacterium]|nr:hypothetical protein [Thermoanaerobaculia bacterium]